MIGLLVGLAAGAELTVWHAYRGSEREAFEAVLREWDQGRDDLTVAPLFVPYETLPDKVLAAVPRGNGPDLFVYAHEKAGEWADAGVVLPVAPAPGVHPLTLDALTVDGAVYGWPLAYKCLALFYDRARVPTPPASTDELFRLATALADGEGEHRRWGFAYEVTSAYMNAAWMHGHGGGVLDGDTVRLDRPENVAAFALVQRLATELVPAEPSGALVTQLFNEGRAAMIVSGPWFLGEVAPTVDWGLAPLPVVSETGRPASPYVTVEAVWLAREGEAARELGAWLASDAVAARRHREGRQIVANPAVPFDDPRLEAFRAGLEHGVVMPTSADFGRTWEPLARAMRRLARGAVSPEAAAAEAQTTYLAVSRPLPPARDPRPWAWAVGLLAAVGLAVGLRRVDWAGVARERHAYAWVAPATVGVLLLTVAPFLVGATVSLFEREGQGWRFVGLANFVDILLARDFPVSSPLSFWYTLAVTLGWTAVNVALHVSIGVALAMLMREPWVRLRGVFRALLILPWAVPSYITALAWKGMFHRQFGAINAILDGVGAAPVSWFAQWSTAFAANVVTNTWLGFPFMMVVTLGALQSIPRELEEAAEVDGATGWQRFRHVTLPLLAPALLPAVILGSVWTFNMFNVIYLVSAGEPDGSTEILISQAYRWAFSRGHRYGYAAAYAVIIFGVLVLQRQVANRLAGRRVV